MAKYTNPRKKWQQYLAETHQNDLDSSTDTDNPSE